MADSLLFIHRGDSGTVYGPYRFEHPVVGFSAGQQVKPFGLPDAYTIRAVEMELQTGSVTTRLFVDNLPTRPLYNG